VSASTQVPPRASKSTYKRAFGNVSVSQCLWAPGHRYVWVDSPGGGRPLLNDCRYNENGKAPQFEAFPLGGYRYKLKSIGDWEYNGGSHDGASRPA
jgi:hypothetical protein